MEDLLSRIRQTEEEAGLIISRAENESKSIIENAKSEALKKSADFKNSLAAALKKRREELIAAAVEEKNRIISDKILEFDKMTSGLDGRKKEAFEYLKRIIRAKAGE